MTSATPTHKFQFTKNENGEVNYFDMAGNPIDPPSPNTKVRVIDHDPRILPMQHKTKGKAGLNAMSSLTKNRVFIR